MKPAKLAEGLTEKQLALTPMCNACGWRMGGLDSWNGHACKCGHISLTFRALFAAAAVAALTSCAAVAPFGNAPGVVVWHRVPAAQVDAACRAKLITSPDIASYRACSWLAADGCHIIAADFQRIEERAAMASLGHELKHCFNGAWHP